MFEMLFAPEEGSLKFQLHPVITPASNRGSIFKAGGGAEQTVGAIKFAVGSG